MIPILFKLGPFTFYTYGLCVALGIYLGFQIALKLAVKDGYRGKEFEDNLVRLLFSFVIGGILGGRAFYVLINWNEFSLDPLGIFKVWQGGLVSYGGLLGALAGFMIWRRKNKEPGWKKIADWFSPALCFGHALGRMGCFFAGCCYGLPTRMPWGVTFTDPRSLANPLGVPLHPTQLYESAYLILLGIFLLWRTNRSGKPAVVIPAQAGIQASEGSVFFLYLVLYSMGRFLIEFFRNDDPRIHSLTPGQWMSGFVFLLAISKGIAPLPWGKGKGG